MRLLLVFFLAVTRAAVASAQDTAIQNGRAQISAGLSIDRAIASLGSGPDAVWLAWRVPMVPGDRDLCSTWTDDRRTVRGAALDPDTVGPPSVPPATGTVALEAASTLIVLARVVDSQVERVRAVTGNCPIDAGGRTVFWLTSATPAESVRALDALTRPAAAGVSVTRRLAESALGALALHRDPSADAVLDRRASDDTDAGLRQRAALELGAARGSHGVATLTALIRDEPRRDVRQNLVAALAASGEPTVTALLLNLARTDADARVRGEAAYRYVRRTGASGLTEALGLMNTDADDGVKRRVVSAVASMPESSSIPVLIDLAGTNRNLAVRKEAASVLSRSKDRRAMAFLESVLAEGR